MNDETIFASMRPLPQLGQLTSVPVRSVWPREDLDFTPWLAQPKNLDLLSHILQLGPLAVEGTEVPVGDFFIDILAKDGNGGRVIIENQFGRTDHPHLGQIMTYVAGQEGAVTVVWIAEKFREEHRAAIDWLNANTLETMNFFAAELEALKIGVSLPAPWFNIVAKPNDWTRTTQGTMRLFGEGGINEKEKAQMAYWASFSEYVRQKGSPIRAPSARKLHYFSLNIGRRNFDLSAGISIASHLLIVELYISKDPQKRAFKALFAEKQAIENELGYEVNWEEQPGSSSCRIAVYKDGVDPTDPKQFVNLHSWMLEKILDFKRVFQDRVVRLDLNDDDGPIPQDADQ